MQQLRVLLLIAALVGAAASGPVEDALAAGDECRAGDDACALNALQLRAAAKTAQTPAAADVALAQEDEEEAGERPGCFAASSCGARKCRMDDCCQKIGNNGGRPITGTIKCRACRGGWHAAKCQVWPGIGSSFTCGCTV
uniref:Uncharacterized protein n=1 Tax=Strombidinopsis acuminata TaxID=141414 RepID=A0A7S3W6V0_9SPIT|mmetsp:Transcript_16840/g.23217  ORF Transcript_16840/g.23217 Transcript_16840/m.23217 type:complete len:140 (+) Transcript_16840:110-529(+)